MEALKINLPYPSFDEVTEDKKTAIILLNAYASAHGELNAVLQYIYHYFYYSKLGEIELAQTILRISLAEMEHFELLGEAILKLGVDPVYIKPCYKTEFYSTASVSYSKSICKMLMDDISGELEAINTYEKILSQIDNEKIETIISRIKLDEELHVKILKEYYTDYCKRKY